MNTVISIDTKRLELLESINKLKNHQIGIIKRAYSLSNASLDELVDNIPETDLGQLLVMVNNTIFCNKLDDM